MAFCPPWADRQGVMKGAPRVTCGYVLAFRWTPAVGNGKMADVAIYHFNATTVSRAAGRSSTAAASYRAGERIEDARTGEIHDYTRKGGVISSEIILPGGGTANRSQLWNNVEAHHKRGDAVVAREFELALPCELTDNERQELAAEFARGLADTYGVGVDYSIHAPSHDERNHHVHMLMTACYCSPTGDLGKKAVELDPIHCARAKIPNAVEVQRAKWQDVANTALERAGQDARIDHRTLEAQGITDRLPGVHLGPVAAEMEREGKKSQKSLNRDLRVLEFMAKVQADAAIQAAAVRDVAELERELASAKAEVARPRSRQELEAELEPMLAKLKTAQGVIDEGNRRRPNAKPLAKVEGAKKALPEIVKKSGQARKRAIELSNELDTLPWWRWLRKRELVKALPLARHEADKLAKRLEACQAMAKATPLETLEIVVVNNKAIQADLAPQCWPLERQLASIEAQEAAVRAKEAALEAARQAEAAKARAMQLQAKEAAQKADYDRMVAEHRARPRAPKPEPSRARDRDNYPRPGR